MEKHKIFEKIKLFLPNTIFHSFFQGTVFLYFTKLVAAIHCLMNTVFISEQHLQPWIVYIQCIWQIFLFKAYCNLKGTLAAIHLNGTIIISGEHFRRPLLFSRVLSFFEITTFNRLYFQRYWVNSPSVAAIHSMNGSFLIIK